MFGAFLTTPQDAIGAGMHFTSHWGFVGRSKISGSSAWGGGIDGSAVSRWLHFLSGVGFECAVGWGWTGSSWCNISSVGLSSLFFKINSVLDCHEGDGGSLSITIVGKSIFLDVLIFSIE